MTTETIIPSSPADIAKLKNMIIEASNSKIRIESERDNIKAIKESAKTELGISPSDFNEVLKAYHEQSLAEKQTKLETVAELYDACFPNQG